MEDFAFYLFKVSIALIAFDVVYFIGFKNETFFKLNRFYLIGSLVFSFILPIISIDWLFQDNNNMLTYRIPNEFNLQPFTPSNFLGEEPRSVFRLTNLIAILYLSGLSLFIVKFIIGLNAIVSTRSKPIEIKGMKVIPVDSNWCFSFMNKILINKKLLNDVNIHSILDHEMAHIKQKHSFDVLLSEIATALLWFNPFVFFHKKTLKRVHEYLADEYVLTKNHQADAYIQTVVNHNFFAAYSTTNHFSNQNIKKRIIMMTKNKSNKIKTLKYSVFVPLVFILSLALSKVNLGAQSPPLTAKSTIENGVPDINPIKKADNPKISNGYGYFVNPFTNKKTFHKALDISAKEGTPVYATISGNVVKAEFIPKSYGKVIVIKNNNGFSTLYAHLSKISVEKDQSIKKGQVIGYVGNTGMSTGPHLHYEVLKDDEHLNPAEYVSYQK